MYDITTRMPYLLLLISCLFYYFAYINVASRVIVVYALKGLHILSSFNLFCVTYDKVTILIIDINVYVDMF